MVINYLINQKYLLKLPGDNSKYIAGNQPDVPTLAENTMSHDIK